LQDWPLAETGVQVAKELEEKKMKKKRLLAKMRIRKTNLTLFVDTLSLSMFGSGAGGLGSSRLQLAISLEH